MQGSSPPRPQPPAPVDDSSTVPIARTDVEEPAAIAGFSTVPPQPACPTCPPPSLPQLAASCSLAPHAASRATASHSTAEALRCEALEACTPTVLWPHTASPSTAEALHQLTRAQHVRSNPMASCFSLALASGALASRQGVPQSHSSRPGGLGMPMGLGHGLWG